MVIGVGCSGSGASPAPRSLPDAARAYTEAFLHGNSSDLAKLSPPGCTPLSDSQLQTIRHTLGVVLKTDISHVQTTDINTRNVTATSGEAHVSLNVDSSTVGDAWVRFASSNTGWRTTACQAVPIGSGKSVSSVGTTTANS
jgi:hypothetical protein